MRETTTSCITIPCTVYSLSGVPVFSSTTTLFFPPWCYAYSLLTNQNKFFINFFAASSVTTSILLLLFTAWIPNGTKRDHKTWCFCHFFLNQYQLHHRLHLRRKTNALWFECIVWCFSWYILQKKRNNEVEVVIILG